MKYEYEAVSGDQSLFDMVGGSEGYSCILLNKKTASLFASNLAPRLDDSSYHLLAERKVKEKYIPKAGDVFAIINQSLDHSELLCLKSNLFGVAFEYLDGEIGHFDSISTSAHFEFIRKHEDKAANPVNFTSEKYVPRVGDIFAIKNKMGEISPIVFVASSVGINSVIVNPLLESVTGSSNKTIYFSDADFLFLKRPSTK